MNSEESAAFVNHGVIPCYYMGPNDTVVNDQAAYALGDEEADALIVSNRGFESNTKRKKELLRRRVQRGCYKLTNRITDSLAMSIPTDLFEVAAHDIDKYKRATSGTAIDVWKDPIYLCLVGADTYEDPFLLRRFRGETYCWNEKRQMWCRAFGGVEAPTTNRPEIAALMAQAAAKQKSGVSV